MKWLFLCMCIFSSVLGKPNRIIRNSSQGSKQQCPGGSDFTQGHLKWKCQGGVPRPIACIGGDRINNQEIPINSTMTIDGYWYKCQIDGTSVKYQEEHRCEVGGNFYHVNDIIKWDNLILKCTLNAVVPTGCYFNDENGKEITIKNGETFLVDQVQHNCGETQRAPICIDDGKTYKPGDKWKGSTDFQYTCTEDATITVTACVTPTGAMIPVGQSKVIQNHYHQCIKDESGQFTYSADPCNVSIQCEGPNIGRTIG